MRARAMIPAQKPAVKTTPFSHRTQKPNPSLSPNSPIDNILYLQRTIGNRAVHRLIKSGTLQAKLRIGQPNDRYGQEADRVMQQVMRMPGLRGSRQPEKEEEIKIRKDTNKTPKTTPERKACVKKECIPDNHQEAMPLQGVVYDYFEMNIDWDSTGSACDCSAGEYRQFVKGYVKVNGKPIEKKLFGGAILKENDYQEDADEEKGRPYGHREGYKNTRIDKFIDPGRKISDRNTACSYRGEDTPHIMVPSGAYVDMDLMFKGYTYDRYKKTEGEIHEWPSKWKGRVP